MVRAFVVDKHLVFLPVSVPFFHYKDCREILKMRKSLWIILAVLLVTIAAPNAHADSFSVTFTSQFGHPPPTAMDVTFPSPTLDITWQGIAFTVAFPSSFLPGDSYGWGTQASGTNVTMFIEDFTVGLPFIFSDIVSVPAGFVHDAGNLTFTPTVAAPEPSSIALMLLGIGLVLVMRTRIGQRLPQAS